MGFEPGMSVRLYEAEEMKASACSPSGNVRDNGPEMLQGPTDVAEPLYVLNSK